MEALTGGAYTFLWGPVVTLVPDALGALYVGALCVGGPSGQGPTGGTTVDRAHRGAHSRQGPRGDHSGQGPRGDHWQWTGPKGGPQWTGPHRGAPGGSQSLLELDYDDDVC